MDKLKAFFFKINAKAPVLKILSCAAIIAAAVAAYGMIDLFTFEPNFLVLYGLEDAGTVRSRVEEQMRRYKPKPPPEPAPPPQMSYDVRLLRQHNPYLPAGMVEQIAGDREDKFTDVTGIDLIGTVYSYTRERRSALIEFNGVALVVLEGKQIRGTQKKVVDIGRSRISVQEEGLLPSPVYLPHEYGLDDLTRALAANEYKSKSNWDYDPRGGKKIQVSKEEGEEGTDEGASKAEGAKEDKKGGKKDAGAAEPPPDEGSEEEEEEEEPPPDESGGGGGGVDIGGGP